MLGKLFGKKKSGYYLELSEDEASAVPASKPAPKAAKAAPSKAPEAKKSEPAKATEGETPTPAAAAAPAKQAVPAVPTAVSKAASAMPQEVATPEPMSDPLELIRTALAASANQTAAGAEAAESNFAPDYLAPKPSARRRRPGPSMSPFKSMAKDMKKTTSGF
ncbi:MAG: hypothetical protein ACFB14_22005 [Leptolyngbyaceae cyanobacterium]